MDPNANVQERINLLVIRASKGWTTEEYERYDELERAYAEWRNNGGFPAKDELLVELQAARKAYNRGVSGAEIASRQMTGVNPYASSWNWKL